MKLSAPKQIVFLISIILIIVGLVGRFVPFLDFGIGLSYWLTLAGGVLLSLGCLLKGL